MTQIGNNPYIDPMMQLHNDLQIGNGSWTSSEIRAEGLEVPSKYFTGVANDHYKFNPETIREDFPDAGPIETLKDLKNAIDAKSANNRRVAGADNKEQSVNDIINKFISGNMKRFEAELELDKLEIQCKVNDNNDNRILEFYFNDKKYHIECVKNAADDGQGGNVVENITPEKVDELVSKYGDEVKKYFKEVAKIDDKVVAYALDFTEWPEGVNKTLAALETKLAEPTETEQEKALRVFIEEFADSDSLSADDFSNLKNLLNAAEIKFDEKVVNGGKKTVIEFNFKDAQYYFVTNAVVQDDNDSAFQRADLEGVVTALGEDWSLFFTNTGDNKYTLNKAAIEDYFGKEVADNIKTLQDLIDAYKNGPLLPDDVKNAIENGFDKFDDFQKFIDNNKNVEIVKASVNSKNYTVEITIKFKGKEFTVLIDNAGTGSARKAAYNGLLSIEYIFKDMGVDDIDNVFLPHKSDVQKGTTGGANLHLTSADGVDGNELATELYNAIVAFVSEILHDSDDDIDKTLNWDNIIQNIWNDIADKYAGKNVSYEQIVNEVMNEIANRIENNSLQELTKTPEYKVAVDDNISEYTADELKNQYKLTDRDIDIFFKKNNGKYEINNNAVKYCFGIEVKNIQELMDAMKGEFSIGYVYGAYSMGVEKYTQYLIKIGEGYGNNVKFKLDLEKIANDFPGQQITTLGQLREAVDNGTFTKADLEGLDDFSVYRYFQKGENDTYTFRREHIEADFPGKTINTIDQLKQAIYEKINDYSTQSLANVHLSVVLNSHESELKALYQKLGGTDDFSTVKDKIYTFVKESFAGKLSFSDKNIIDKAEEFIKELANEENQYNAIIDAVPSDMHEQAKAALEKAKQGDLKAFAELAQYGFSFKDNVATKQDDGSYKLTAKIGNVEFSIKVSKEAINNAINGLIKDFMDGIVTKDSATTVAKSLGLEITEEFAVAQSEEWDPKTADGKDWKYNYMTIKDLDGNEICIRTLKAGGSVGTTFTPDKLEDLSGEEIKTYFDVVCGGAIVLYAASNNWPAGIAKTVEALKTYLKNPPTRSEDDKPTGEAKKPSEVIDFESMDDTSSNLSWSTVPDYAQWNALDEFIPGWISNYGLSSILGDYVTAMLGDSKEYKNILEEATKNTLDFFKDKKNIKVSDVMEYLVEQFENIVDKMAIEADKLTDEKATAAEERVRSYAEGQMTNLELNDRQKTVLQQKIDSAISKFIQDNKGKYNSVKEYEAALRKVVEDTIQKYMENPVTEPDKPSEVLNFDSITAIGQGWDTVPDYAKENALYSYIQSWLTGYSIGSVLSEYVTAVLGDDAQYYSILKAATDATIANFKNNQNIVAKDVMKYLIEEFEKAVGRATK